MIVDMRLRPPFGSFLTCGIYGESPYYPTRMGFPRPASALSKSVDALLDEMDQAVIAWGVIMGRSGSSIGSIANEEICEFVKGHPERFVWFAGLDVHDVPAAIAEAELWSDKPNLVGFGIEPALAREPVFADDPKLYPLYETCVRLGKPVSITVSGMMGPDLRYSDPIAIQRVARDFPALRIIVSHGAWPWVHQILGVAFACPNIYLSPDLYMNSKNMPGSAEFARAANLYLSDRLLFGTAYPSRPLVESVAAFDELPLDPQHRRKVLFDNAATLLRLPETRA